MEQESVFLTSPCVIYTACLLHPPGSGCLRVHADTKQCHSGECACMYMEAQILVHMDICV